jgi:hypothetical protein
MRIITTVEWQDETQTFQAVAVDEADWGKFIARRGTVWGVGNGATPEDAFSLALADWAKQTGKEIPNGD